MHRTSASFFFLTGCALVSLPVTAIAQAAPPVAAPAEVAPAAAAQSPAAHPEGGVAAEEGMGEFEAGQPVGSEGTQATSEALPEPAPMPIPQESAGTEVPSPGDLAARLNEGLEDAYDAKDTWTAPVPVFAVHGYMRMRGELMDTFWLGRPMLGNDLGVDPAALGPDPFSRFRPFERTEKSVPCVNESVASNGMDCDVDTLQFANMRLRLSPEMNLTEDVRVKTTFDVLDNVVAGSAPRSFYGIADSSTFSDTLAPAGGGRSSSIVARRAWAEVRNRDLGELRFGRMPSQWGLGMRYNAGNGLDQDYSTDMDRAMGIVKFAGFYFTASYDFVAEGITGLPPGSSADYSTSIPDYRPDLDSSQLDDVDQFSASVARRLSEEEEREILERGDLVLNGGLHFELRHQDAMYLRDTSAGANSNANDTLQSVSFTRYTPDLWGQLKWPWGRIEAEAAWALGKMNDISGSSSKQMSINQLGAALESELRFFEDKFAVFFDSGFASGDSSVEGLSANADFLDQLDGDKRISTYSFHPSYQVDMILWRNIMRQVTAAYYFKPGLSYDFVRTDFGELFGARVDVIWSRASSFLQTPGNSSNLGVELNAKVYWRSEDGTELTDGYHASMQYGVLFPLNGLGLPAYEGLKVNLQTAQQLRLVLGVVF